MVGFKAIAVCICPIRSIEIFPFFYTIVKAKVYLNEGYMDGVAVRFRFLRLIRQPQTTCGWIDSRTTWHDMYLSLQSLYEFTLVTAKTCWLKTQKDLKHPELKPICPRFTSSQQKILQLVCHHRSSKPAVNEWRIYRYHSCESKRNFWSKLWSSCFKPQTLVCTNFVTGWASNQHCRRLWRQLRVFSTAAMGE